MHQVREKRKTSQAKARAHAAAHDDNGFQKEVKEARGRGSTSIDLMIMRLEFSKTINIE
jgi:hypothetical protein